MKIGWELDLTKEIERRKCKCGNGCIVIYEYHYSSKKPPYRSETETERSLHCEICNEVNNKIEVKKQELDRVHDINLKRIDNDFSNIILTIVNELNSSDEVSRICHIIKSKKNLYSILTSSCPTGALGTFYKEHNSRSISEILKYYADKYIRLNNLVLLQKYTTNLYSQLNLEVSDNIQNLFKVGKLLEEEGTIKRRSISEELIKYETDLYTSM